MLTPTSIGLRIRNARLSRGISEHQLAQRAGWPVAQRVLDVEAGLYSLPKEELAALVQALDVPLHKFLDPFEVAAEAQTIWLTERGAPASVVDMFEPAVLRWASLARWLMQRFEAPPGAVLSDAVRTLEEARLCARDTCTELQQDFGATMSQCIEGAFGIPVLVSDGPDEDLQCCLRAAVCRLPQQQLIWVKTQLADAFAQELLLQLPGAISAKPGTGFPRTVVGRLQLALARGHMSVRKAAGLMGLTLQDLRLLFAEHRLPDPLRA